VDERLGACQHAGMSSQTNDQPISAASAVYFSCLEALQNVAKYA
jgi:hypothetical protein